MFDAVTGELVTQAYREYTSTFPHPAWVEQRADDWWDTAASTCQASMKALGRRASQLAAVSITNQRETIVPVDEAGKPLSNAIVWQDRRTVPQCAEIRDRLGVETVYRETGLTIDPYFSASKILWFMKEAPQVFRAARKFLLVHDFILNRLTGQFATDYSNASRTMLFSVERFEWSRRMCDELQIPEELLPTAHPSGTVVGHVTRSAARATGLPEGLPVVAGGGDQQCAAVGVGVVSPGRVKATIGTGTFILAHEEQPRFDTRHRLLCSCHAVPQKWVMEASIFTSGIVYRWFRDQFCSEEKELAALVKVDAYDLVNEQARQSPPGSRGVLLLPHFVGAGAPYWNPAARGALLGLALGHNRVDVIRSIMEGSSLEVRRNIEVMRSLGIVVDELRITGGATRSSAWNQILADICRLSTLRSRVEEATALGAAVLASVGAGIHRNVLEAASKMVAIGDRYRPSPEHQSLYDELYAIQGDAYEALEKAKVFARLAALHQ
jgi:xylulokinase